MQKWVPWTTGSPGYNTLGTTEEDEQSDEDTLYVTEKLEPADGTILVEPEPAPVAAAPSREDIEGWGVEGVCEWLVSLKLPPAVVEKFRENEVRQNTAHCTS